MQVEIITGSTTPKVNHATQCLAFDFPQEPTKEVQRPGWWKIEFVCNKPPSH